MHPVIMRQLAADHIAELHAKADDERLTRLARQARRARRRAPSMGLRLPLSGTLSYDDPRLDAGQYLTVAPPADGDRQGEIRRLEAMGATVIAVGEGEVDLVIMEDPEGNGFSVLSPRE